MLVFVKHLLAPAVALMRRLRYPYKFALIGVLALSEILFLFYPLARNLQRSRELTRLELNGVALDRALLALIQLAQQHRGLSAGMLGGTASFSGRRDAKQEEVERALAEADLALARYGAGLQLDAQWQEARVRWELLRGAAGLKMGAAENRRAHTAFIQLLLDMVAKLGDTSSLVLDSGAASYHLIDAATLNMPGTLELLGQLRAHGAAVLASKTVDDSSRLSFAGELAVLRSKREALEVSLGKVARSSPQLAEPLLQFSTQFNAAIDALLSVVNEDIVKGDRATPPERYVEIASKAIDLGFEQAQNLLLPRLQGLLEQRAEGLDAELRQAALLTAASMLVFAYLAAAAYLVVMASVQTLRTGADRMATGDLTTPIELQARDELQLVAASFNHMGEQLAARTHQLHQRDTALLEVQASYERAQSQAVLAALVPSIAHDLVTPIGNTRLAASTLTEKANAFQGKLQDGSLRKSELEAFLRQVQEGVAIIESAGQRSGELATQLKQLSIDQVSERRRVFELEQLLDEVLTLLKPTLANASWRIERRLQQGLQFDSYPGPLGQVLLNLIQNAATHAFEGRSSGLLLIEAQADAAGTIRILLRDDGRGMAPEVLAQVFKPFFTTKPDRGGSGVGLAYARRLVESPLGGRLDVESALGVGTSFCIELPRVAPLPRQTGSLG
ncbi:ATP-binding protein [Paucibacter soli]|uniref:ATP-binding protein n=1 Tax=Paucibacter soli TaxID=3133433 RepID=UPI00309500EA